MGDENNKDLELYLRSLRRKSENTKYNYLLDVKQFLNWVKDTQSEYMFEEELSRDEYEDIFEDYKFYLFGE